MKFAKVMFSQVFVCPQEGVSVQGVPVQGVSVQGVPVQGGLCPGGSLSREVSVQGGLCPGGSLSKRTPYGNVRAVRILLECILVHNAILFIATAFSN